MIHWRILKVDGFTERIYLLWIARKLTEARNAILQRLALSIWGN